MYKALYIKSDSGVEYFYINKHSDNPFFVIKNEIRIHLPYVLHNEKGPAIKYPNGAVEYWLNDKNVSYNSWLLKTKPALKAFI